MSEARVADYETMYVLRSGLSDSDAATIHSKIDSVIQKFQGALKQRDDWGLRELAFEIDNERMGRYCVIGYTGAGGVVEEIERHFKISSDVIRFMTLRVAPEYDYSKKKKEILQSEEEVKKAREIRKKGI